MPADRVLTVYASSAAKAMQRMEEMLGRPPEESEIVFQGTANRFFAIDLFDGSGVYNGEGPPYTTPVHVLIIAT